MIAELKTDIALDEVIGNGNFPIEVALDRDEEDLEKKTEIFTSPLYSSYKRATLFFELLKDYARPDGIDHKRATQIYLGSPVNRVNENLNRALFLTASNLSLMIHYTQILYRKSGFDTKIAELKFMNLPYKVRLAEVTKNYRDIENVNSMLNSVHEELEEVKRQGNDSFDKGVRKEIEKYESFLEKKESGEVYKDYSHSEIMKSVTIYC